MDLHHRNPYQLHRRLATVDLHQRSSDLRPQLLDLPMPHKYLAKFGISCSTILPFGINFTAFHGLTSIRPFDLNCLAFHCLTDPRLVTPGVSAEGFPSTFLLSLTEGFWVQNLEVRQVEFPRYNTRRNLAEKKEGTWRATAEAEVSGFHGLDGGNNFQCLVLTVVQQREAHGALGQPSLSFLPKLSVF
ncbi:hypothetical protein LR48_Vigan07g146200 [Vigna angularis]|uniref:Uncharacterized protein n=1 Tax=Phaseolus angularis TaxID=3914 RepID=A0A0L9UY99_PHAAN|nr:hypothetical protein LR48_Vigan07g146200 [Vigna angularis]